MSTLKEDIQGFCKAMEIAIADNFPDNKSDYQILKIGIKDKLHPLWVAVERHIASFIARWPEWSTILKGEEYNITLDDIVETPKKFKYFDLKIKNTILEIEKYLCGMIREAISLSIKRFEEHHPYQEKCEKLRARIKVKNFDEFPEALPLLDAWSPSRLIDNVVPIVIERMEDSLNAMKFIRFPYNNEKDCEWNLALVIRLQLQILKTLREKIFDIIAAAEIQFRNFFTHEVLEGELLPLIRNNLNNKQFTDAIFSDTSAV